jgi:hypothetical protein
LSYRVSNDKRKWDARFAGRPWNTMPTDQR